MSQFLVNTPKATEFLTLASTNAGRRSMLGDDEKFPGLGQTIRDAHESLRTAVERVTALVRDKTRTDVARHEAAKMLADNAGKQLAFARNYLAAKSEDLAKDSQAVAQAVFELRGERSAIDAQIMAWVKEQAATDNGVSTIRKTALSEPQLAAVLFQAPNFLLGINAKSHDRLKLDVTEKYAPSAFADMERSAALHELLPRYDKAISGVHSSFYNPSIAEQSASRVEVA